MKLIAVCVVCAVLFCGCGVQQQLDQALAFRQKMLQSEGCSFLCKITADYVEKLYTFTMECSFDKSGNMSFKVVEPDSISGITGTVDNRGGNLTFDEQALAFELLADGYITPVSAPWLMVKTVRGGYMESCSQESDTFRITFYDSYEENALQLDVWLDANQAPIRCEIVWQGRRILSLAVSSFSFV